MSIKTWQERRARYTGYSQEQAIRKEVEHLQKECAELRAELDRVTALAHGQHVELHNARLELTALRNQEPAITVKMCGHNPPRIVGTNGELPQGRVGFYLAAGAQPVPTLSKEAIRACGGIVHSDGNVFFTSIDQLNATLESAKEMK